MAVSSCSRCDQNPPDLSSPPYPGALGEEIRRRICSRCLAEWQAAEVMVINELRLDFMDPRSQGVLEGHMREFFGLDPVTSE